MPSSAIRFGLRTLLGITAAIAISIALLIKFPVAVSGILCAAAMAYVVRCCLRHPPYRLPAAALLCSMILPYAWVVSYEELDRIAPALPMLFASLPTFFPAAWGSSLLGQHFQESQWLAILLTAVELTAGMWVIRLGDKRTIVFLLLAMLTSAMGSLVFYQLCVM